MCKVFPAILGVVGIDYWHGRVAVICLDLQEKKTHLVDKHLVYVYILLLAAEKYSDYTSSSSRAKTTNTWPCAETRKYWNIFFFIWQFGNGQQWQRRPK